VVRKRSPQKEPSHRNVTLQSQPSEERNGEALLCYSGRTALRREQCNVDDKALLGNDPASEALRPLLSNASVNTFQQWNEGVFSAVSVAVI
jgi:hypothetical protein